MPRVFPFVCKRKGFVFYRKTYFKSGTKVPSLIYLLRIMAASFFCFTYFVFVNRQVTPAKFYLSVPYFKQTARNNIFSFPTQDMQHYKLLNQIIGVCNCNQYWNKTFQELCDGLWNIFMFWLEFTKPIT